MRYAFIRDHEQQFAVRTMCRVMKVHPSGFYAWKHTPDSARAWHSPKFVDVFITQFDVFRTRKDLTVSSVCAA